MLTAQEIFEELQRRSRLGDEAFDELFDQITRSVEAERIYRTKKAQLTVEKGAMPDPITGKKKTDRIIEAEVDLEIGHEREAHHLNEQLRWAYQQKLKLRIGQLSAAQSAASAFREEVALSRTGPQMSP